MLLIVHRKTKKVINNNGKNPLFPDGNVPNVALKENELAVRVHDDSDNAKIIESCTHDGYEIEIEEVQKKEIVRVPIDGEEDQFGAIEKVVESYFIVKSVKVIKTLQEYTEEISKIPVKINVKEDIAIAYEAIASLFEQNLKLTSRITALEGGEK
jgi:hypothetical protein